MGDECVRLVSRLVMSSRPRRGAWRPRRDTAQFMNAHRDIEYETWGNAHHDRRPRRTWFLYLQPLAGAALMDMAPRHDIGHGTGIRPGRINLPNASVDLE